ncbi:hypothetical protein CSOJ01_07884 [Colletotrichum sojae]|uniref:Uncharacterized protein n=1 Tax=Colletotrichum sojae TaxID=2175907 RepID=A0A8H6J7H2_9PEZI|nr:hypothetical protein CSOJ01_07884 [Colletotrichum sojae]
MPKMDHNTQQNPVLSAEATRLFRSLPNEITQLISASLPSKDHLQWTLSSRFYYQLLSKRLLPNACARGDLLAFVWACETGNLAVMETCTLLGVSPRSRTACRWTVRIPRDPEGGLPVIAISLLANQIDAVRLLISRGASLEDLPVGYHPHLRTLLHYARHASTLQFLFHYENSKYRDLLDWAYVRDSIWDIDTDDHAMMAFQLKPGLARPDLMQHAITVSRLTLVKRLFEAFPDLVTSANSNWRLQLHYLWLALSSGESDIQEMVETVNAATGVLPQTTFSSKAERVFKRALFRNSVSPTTFKWLLRNGLVDIYSPETCRFLHRVVLGFYHNSGVLRIGTPVRVEIAHIDGQVEGSQDRWFEMSSAQVLQTDTVTGKMNFLLAEDKSFALYLPICNSRRNGPGYITCLEFLNALESELSSGKLAPHVDMSPSDLLMKLLAFGTHEGTLQRTARVVKTLVALGASGSTLVTWWTDGPKGPDGQRNRDLNRRLVESETALLYAGTIKADPGGGRCRDIPQASEVDMSADHEISTYEEYLALRRASIGRIRQALLACPLANEPSAIGFSSMADARKSVEQYDDLRSRSSGAEIVASTHETQLSPLIDPRWI